ncbi:MAG TPA: HAMP domain-containing sensor histidine kinase [Vicinamibacterales bacterium]
MWRRFQPPLALVSLTLVGLIAVLAWLQYHWLGQISEAERAQRRATLAAGAQEFAQDFDREINRAYLLFQSESRLIGQSGQFPTDPAGATESDEQIAQRFAARYDHWQANSRFPRVLKDVYAFTQGGDGTASLRKYDPARRTLEPVEWPAAMSNWRAHLDVGAANRTSQNAGAIVIRRIPNAIWEDVPAIVVPSPITVVATAGEPFGRARASITATFQHALRMPQPMAYSILAIDADYVRRELLPALAQRHFSQGRDSGGANGALDFKVAVVSKGGPIFQSPSSFAPAIDSPADATADLFQVRTQDFTALVSEVRRFTALAGARPPSASQMPGSPAENVGGRVNAGDGRPLSIFIQENASGGGVGRTSTTSTRVTTSGSTPLWKLVVAHPSGSLETAVAAARRRNVVISFSILGILGASMGLLILATRRAQRLAKQQMEFVAAVSHELRTPLAVIRSAAENLADGVVHDEDRIRRYGELMRSEGRRLTEMVEQILEFAGIQSGQRGFALRPVAIDSLIRDILSSSAAIIDGAGLTVDLDLPPNLPSVLGDEPALRRVFQNLIDNAIKYGASGGWIRVSARAEGSTILVTVADRGIGIEPADQDKIFEPFYRAADVVAAQMQGAGLGLSLVQRIVAAHGGQVAVKSAPRNGSEFTVALPAKAGSQETANRETANHETADAANPADGPPEIRSHLETGASERERVSLASGAGLWGSASEPVGGLRGAKPPGKG